MSPSHFEKMVLVGPTGIRPPVGEIYDMFLVVSKEFLTANYHDPAGVAEFQQICPDEPSPEQVEAWEIARESSSRLAWRPYLYDPSLPHLLHRVRNLPTQNCLGKRRPDCAPQRGGGLPKGDRGEPADGVGKFGPPPGNPKELRNLWPWSETFSLKSHPQVAGYLRCYNPECPG